MTDRPNVTVRSNATVRAKVTLTPDELDTRVPPNGPDKPNRPVGSNMALTPDEPDTRAKSNRPDNPSTPVAEESAKAPDDTLSAAPGTRQQELLVLLKQWGSGTIPDLAERTGLNVETVRHHVQALSKQGLIGRTGTRARGRGRPEIVYGLSAAAEALFPRREGEVLSALAEHLKATGNEAALESFFEAYIDARRPSALARVEGLKGRARVEEVARILSELGFMAVADPGRQPALRLCNCPIRELVGATTIPCRAELGFVRELLGGERLTRLSYMPAGDASCTYAAGREAGGPR